MKHRSASLLALGLGFSLSACGGGGSGAAGGAGSVDVTWSLKNVDGTAAACAPGYETMKITANGYFAATNSSDHLVDTSALFDCAAGAGTIDLPGNDGYDGRYNLKWEETNSTGNTVYMQDQPSFASHNVVVDVSHGDATAAMTMYPTGGYFWAEWSLYGDTVMTYLDSCAGAGVDRIEVTFTDDTTMAVTTRNYSCDGTNGRGGVELDDFYSVGGAIDPITAGYYHAVGKAFLGSTEVGTTDNNNTVNIEDRNKISILDTNLGFRLTTR